MSETPNQLQNPERDVIPLAQRGLASLTLTDFRNIETASLNFCPGLNLIHGENGSGKTSLLEAIFILGRVRSFRTNQPMLPIRHGQQAYCLFGRIFGDDGRVFPLGIERSRTALNVHFKGERVHRLSDLAGSFPVQVLSGDTETLFSGGPRFRRHSLDWALFHVEHTYREAWQRYAKILRQRNAAIRSQANNRMVRVWDGDLIAAAMLIGQLRETYLDELANFLTTETEAVLPGTCVSLRYARGWPAATSLEEAIENSLEKDRAYGATYYGIHRADIRLLVNGHEVDGHCSRGQQKAIQVAFMLAQLRLQQSRGMAPGTFLLDDLSSELDQKVQQRVLHALRNLGTQVFVSQIGQENQSTALWPEYRVFHVEHGKYREVL